MRAVVKYAPGDGNVDIREVDEPVCGDDQAKIEIAFCGVCGTDIHVLRDTFRNYPPVILGHELAGTVVALPDQLYPVPDGMTLQEAALSEPFAAIVQAVLEIARVQRGETALVSGPGPMGLLCVKLLVAEGVKTIVAGTSADGARLEAARSFGASRVVDVEREGLADAVRDDTGG